MIAQSAPTPTALVSSPAIEPQSPRVQLMTITPAKAAEWLERNNTRNRTLGMAYAERLAQEIVSGRWRITHEGIAFSVNGVLLDGQHRLQAIVLARRPVQLFVWYDVSPEALMAINCGKARSLADTLNLSGTCGEVSSHLVATLRVMLGGMGSPRTLTAGAAEEDILMHREAIEFALAHLPPSTRFRGVATSVTRAVVARAWYSADRQQIADFCKVLTSGMAMRDEDLPAQLLFQFLIRSQGFSDALLRERYAKIERALYAYLNRERPAKLYAAAEELFPLPEEIKR